jgi:nifR3 family TIM-barrel protein
MARFTDLPFRQLCKEHGADVMVTEFVMCESLLRGTEQAWHTLDFSEAQRPMGVQLFGSEPGRMAQAARKVADRLRPDFIDINCGCPAQRVTDQCAGSSLLQDPARLRAIVKACVAAVPELPVTVKIRIGWDQQSINAREVALGIVDAGAQALAIHGRTRQQGYSGKANWEVIEAVAREIPIPVIGNGDVACPCDAARRHQTSSVQALMIGRAALGYPWLFKEIKHAMATGEALPPPAMATRWEALLRYVDLLVEHRAPHRGPEDIGWMRAKLKGLTKGMVGVKQLRRQIDALPSVSSFKLLVHRELDLARQSEHLKGTVS